MKHLIKHMLAIPTLLIMALTQAYAHPGHEHNHESFVDVLLHNLAHPSTYLMLAVVAIIGCGYLLRKRQLKK